MGLECDYYDVCVGDLIRWASTYAVFAADDQGNVYPVSPLYEMGIVVEVSLMDECLVCAFVVNGRYGDGYRLIDISDCEEFDILSGVGDIYD